MDPDLLEAKRRYKRQILNAMDDWPQRSKKARPADFHGPLRADECWSPIPTHPSDADVDANMREADGMWPNPFTFKNAVKNGGPWDYKQRSGQYENFGNFNFGAAGTAWGFPAEILKEQAGKAQIAAGTSKREWQKRGGRYHNQVLPPYGDDPLDQAWIQRGIDYAKSGGKGGSTCQ
jgi:hypothetical protein